MTVVAAEVALVPLLVPAGFGSAVALACLDLAGEAPALHDLAPRLTTSTDSASRVERPRRDQACAVPSTPRPCVRVGR